MNRDTGFKGNKTVKFEHNYVNLIVSCDAQEEKNFWNSMGMAGRTTDMQFETECNTHTLLLLAAFKTYNANENNQK